MEAAKDNLDSIITFLTEWEAVDSKFYDHNQGRALLRKEFVEIAHNALKLYYWHDMMGNQQMQVHFLDHDANW